MELLLFIGFISFVLYLVIGKGRKQKSTKPISTTEKASWGIGTLFFFDHFIDGDKNYSPTKIAAPPGQADSILKETEFHDEFVDADSDIFYDDNDFFD